MRILFFLLFTLNTFSQTIPVKCFYTLSENTLAITNYSNANYRETVSGKKVKVEIKYNPLKIKTRYPFSFKDKKLIDLIKKNKKNSEKLLLFAENISEKSKGYYDCVDNVLKFMSKNFKYTERINPPFRGDCNTAAETTVKLLALCGIPARIRYVVKFEQKESVIISGRSLHAIVEIYYPGFGWVFSDPVKYHHFVPASYLLVHNPSQLLGITLSKKNCLTKEAFIDILKRKIIVYKLPNLLRFY